MSSGMDKNKKGKIKTALTKLSKFIIPMRDLQKTIAMGVDFKKNIKFKRVLKLQKYNRQFVLHINALNLINNKNLKIQLKKAWGVDIDDMISTKSHLDSWYKKNGKSIYSEELEKINKLNDAWNLSGIINNTETPTRISWGPPTSRYSERYGDGSYKRLYKDLAFHPFRGKIKSKNPSILKQTKRKERKEGKGGRKYRKKKTKKRRKSRRRKRIRKRRRKRRKSRRKTRR